MLELGAYDRLGHQKVGHRAALIVDVLVTVGQRAAMIAEAARSDGLAREQVYHTDSNDKATEFLRQGLRPGDNVLVKGSRGMRMEQIVQALTVEGD
jgi:UDP-N-acetylmuramoyl-tripeptide--D-alanyl-D-alanine ligase